MTQKILEQEKNMVQLILDLEKKYSGDKVTTDDLLLREINKNKLNAYKYICCIYPATPLLKSEHLKRAFNKFKSKKFNSLI